jgi:cystathionine gamma-synthase
MMRGPSTKALWAGEEERNPYGAAQVPIFQSITFGYPNVEDWVEVATRARNGHIYSRNTNPTVAIFEEKLRQLEDAEMATSFSSGMAAVSNTLFALLKPGNRVVSIRDTYGGTNQLFVDFLPRIGVQVSLCETSDGALHDALEKRADVLYLETPTNPTLKVVDIELLAKAAHDAGALCVVDNTVATPINQQPLRLGADLVVHSASKYLGGHGDALGGVVCGRAELVTRIFHYREITGASLDPFAAYLLLRGLKTLAIRVERQNASALAIANFLDQHPAVSRVYYPGMASDPGHAVAARQMSGFGGMLGFALSGEGSTPAIVLDNLRFAHRAASLGHVETIAGLPSTTSHVECTKEEREAMGIPESLIRYSVGIEDVDDLIADLRNALDLRVKSKV